MKWTSTSYRSSRRTAGSPTPTWPRAWASRHRACCSGFELLEKAGLIRGYFALLDADRLGLRITAWVHITLSLHQEQPIERFRRSIQDIPEILECYHVSGDFDFLIKVIVRDMRAYEAFVREKLTKIKGIQQIKTSFVFGTNKYTTQIAL